MHPFVVSNIWGAYHFLRYGKFYLIKISKDSDYKEICVYDKYYTNDLLKIKEILDLTFIDNINSLNIASIILIIISYIIFDIHLKPL